LENRLQQRWRHRKTGLPAAYSENLQSTRFGIHSQAGRPDFSLPATTLRNCFYFFISKKKE
jgi:hypothetical protein